MKHAITLFTLFFATPLFAHDNVLAHTHDASDIAVMIGIAVVAVKAIMFLIREGVRR